LDTGATYSVVDRRVANRFATAHRSGKVFNFDRFVTVDRMEFPNVHFGPVAVRNVSMRVTELTKLSNLIPSAKAISERRFNSPFMLPTFLTRIATRQIPHRSSPRCMA
jgi:hypothetical protein